MCSSSCLKAINMFRIIKYVLYVFFFQLLNREPINSIKKKKKLKEYLWRSWRRGGRAGRCPAETGCGRGGLASAGLWTSRAGRRPPGSGEPARAAGKVLRQQADGTVGSSLPSAAPWFYWSRLGYPADHQETTFVTRKQPSVQSQSLCEAMDPSSGWYVT